jgi:hypothetical protein
MGCISSVTATTRFSSRKRLGIIDIMGSKPPGFDPRDTLFAITEVDIKAKLDLRGTAPAKNELKDWHHSQAGTRS